MRYQPIDSNLFIGNRARLTERLKPGSVAVVNSNDIMPTNADGSHSFVQSTDLFYLTGIDQEETILIMCPDAIEKKHKEVLFIREVNEETAIWEGEKYTKDQATATSGIQIVYWTRDFERVFRDLVFESKAIYLNTNEHMRADITVETRDARFLRWCKAIYPLHKYRRLAPIMHELRMIKSDVEVSLIQHACNITRQAFLRLLHYVRPGVFEFEIEAEICHEFLKNRSNGPAYPSVIASGHNSCVLHYTKNNRQCLDGELLLMDFGAGYAHFASDVTRTIPVNGRFTERQRDVYNAVLRVQRAAIEMLKPGNTFDEYNKEIGNVVQTELIGLGLLDASAVKDQPEEMPLYKKYFMHGISHHLGLDVHDYGSRHGRFAPGMVLTCEPGIYIREEAIGIRLENDILITDQGPVDLTKDIPIEAEEIETLMHSIK
jgi:Xaa-Pro aminopeptidase